MITHDAEPGLIVGKVVHDIAGAAQAIRSALSLLIEARDDPDLWEEAVALGLQSVGELEHRLDVCRAAYVGSPIAGPDELMRLAGYVFSRGRAQLAWERLDAGFSPSAGQATIILVLVAGAALPAGGEARGRLVLEAGAWRVLIEGHGTRVRAPGGFEAGAQGADCPPGAQGWWAVGRRLRELGGPDGAAEACFGTEDLRLMVAGR